MTLVDRLAKQYTLSYTREQELQHSNVLLKRGEAERNSMQETVDKVRAQKEKAKQLRNQVNKENQEHRQKLQTLIEKDKNIRQETLEKIQGVMEDLQTKVNEAQNAKSKATHENNTLKKQLEILRSNDAMGKIKELEEAKNKEGGSLQQRIQKEYETTEFLEKHIVDSKQTIAEMKPLHAELKAVVDEFSARFTEGQKRLQDANSFFQKAVAEREKLTKRVAVLDKDRLENSKRAERAMKDKDTEKAHHDQLEKQVQLVMAQIEKLEKLHEFLQKPPPPQQQQKEEGDKQKQEQAAVHQDPNA